MLVEVQGLRRVLIAGGGSSVRVVVRICVRVGAAPTACSLAVGQRETRTPGRPGPGRRPGRWPQRPPHTSPHTGPDLPWAPANNAANPASRLTTPHAAAANTTIS